MIKVTTVGLGIKTITYEKNTSVHKDSHGCKKWEIMKCANGDTMTMKITIKLCGVMVLLSY